MLPKLVDPRRLAEQGVSFRETVLSSELPRITEISESDGEVDVFIEFTRDEQGRSRVTGSIQGSIGLICQRCMGQVDTEFQQAIDLVIVWNDDQSKAVPREIDPWEVGEQASLYELIEDEILLALPVVAKHPEGQCKAPQFVSEQTVESLEGGQRPFEILKELTKPSEN